MLFLLHLYGFVFWFYVSVLLVLHYTFYFVYHIIIYHKIVSYLITLYCVYHIKTNCFRKPLYSLPIHEHCSHTTSKQEYQRQTRWLWLGRCGMLVSSTSSEYMHLILYTCIYMCLYVYIYIGRREWSTIERAGWNVWCWDAQACMSVQSTRLGNDINFKRI